jgi:hypothetical protein
MPTQAEISLNPATAKGSLLSIDGSSRISVPSGTNGQILTARSSTSSGLAFETQTSPTAVFELIGSSVLTADAASIIFSDIDTARNYASFTLIYQGRQTTTTGTQIPIRVVVNSNSNGIYRLRGLVGYGGTASYQDSDSEGGKLKPTFYIEQPATTANIVADIQIDFFPEPTGLASRFLHYLTRATVFQGSVVNTLDHETSFGHGFTTDVTTNLTRLELNQDSGAFKSGSFAYLYGWRR